MQINQSVQIIAQSRLQINNNLSHATAPIGISHHASPIPKLHPNDITHLKIARFYCDKGKNAKCHLSKEGWSNAYEQFVGKRVHYTQIKFRRIKLERLGLIWRIFSDGNRNKCMDEWITDAGLEALAHYRTDPIKKKNAQRRTKPTSRKVPKPPFRQYENHTPDCTKAIPQSDENHTPGNTKTIPPLNLRLAKLKEANEFLQIQSKDSRASNALDTMVRFGMNPQRALWHMQKYGLSELLNCYNNLMEQKAKGKKIKNFVALFEWTMKHNAR